jgi:hypothetical protein
MVGVQLLMGGFMFNKPAISMRELELESAELLPSRETLCVTQMQWWPGGRFHRGFRGFRDFGGWGGGIGYGLEGYDFGGCGVGYGFPLGFEGGWGGGIGYGLEGYDFGGCGC